MSADACFGTRKKMVATPPLYAYRMKRLFYIVKVNITLLQTFDDGIGTAAAAEFVEYIGHVGFDGTQADKELFRHFLIAQPTGGPL